MIYVTPLSKLNETVARTGAAQLVSLLTQNTVFERPPSISVDNHLCLFMHDIVDEAPEMVAPHRGHVEGLLEFAQAWDRARPLVINCFAGISRSTAAAYIVAAALNPAREEHWLARALRSASPSATPNVRLVALADTLLAREGRMTRAIEEIGRGADAFEGVPFRFTLD
ncbi:tyrosine phosphatase family protein [Mesorhizobium xinjiangense]|uniref:tyrosine phosphatase family protein n=1 Tax=Mesorhizobium xinjiangense TaxID=2678685 RepID=UPI0012EE19A0|nr:protein tyrosine phosphatase [Mesorhizobium xinjiangense]